MYLKLKIVDDLLTIHNYSALGSPIDLPEDLTVILYKKTQQGFIKILEVSNENQAYINTPLDSHVYADLLIKGKLKQRHLPVKVTKDWSINTYRVSYSSSYGVSPTSNTFLKRYTLSMPAWSSAFKNDVTNYSKVIQPLYLLAEKTLYKTNEYAKSNLFQQPLNNHTFDTSSTSVILVNDATKDYVQKSFIKQKEAINKVTTSPLNWKRIKPFTANVLDIREPVDLGVGLNNLFIKSDKEVTVSLKGLNLAGSFIEEYVYVNDTCLVTSLNKYSKLISASYVTEDTAEVSISNYCPCNEYGATFRSKYWLAGSVTKDKLIEVPSYEFNNEVGTLNSYHVKNITDAGDFEDSYKVPTMVDFSKFFVTDEEDLVFLKDGKLSTGLLRKTLETDMKLYPSNNNNSLVSLLTDDAHLEDTVEFQVSFKEILADYGNVSLKLRIESERGTLYLTDDNEWVEEPTFKLITNANPVYVKINTDGYKYISVVLEFNDIFYQASVRKDYVDTREHNVLLEDMFHTGDFLVGKTEEDRFVRIDLVKDYYEIIGGTTITYSNMNENIKIIPMVRNLS